jgi:DNA-binding transcriptional MerR regulator
MATLGHEYAYGRQARRGWCSASTRTLGRLDSVLGYRVHAGVVRTSEAAALAQVNTQTLRYYERRGLLPEPQRTQSGYRAYTPDAVRLVRFVKRAQQLGFTLDDIEELLHLSEGGPDSCDEARTMSRTRIADLQKRIDELAGMRDALARLIDTCDQPRAQRDCPILRDIETAAITTTSSAQE